ncbi:MAG: TonB family protein [Gloeobacterales cyanobacterium]
MVHDEKEEDLYQLLGVTPDSSMTEIRGAYRILSNEGANLGNDKERLQQAYEVLSNPKKRARYDRQRQKSSSARQDFKPVPIASNYLLYAVSLAGVAFVGFWVGYKLFGGSANPSPIIAFPSTTTTASVDLKSQPFKRPAKPYTPPAHSSIQETLPAPSEPIEPTISSQPPTSATKDQEQTIEETSQQADASPMVQGVVEQAASPQRDARALSTFGEETIRRLNRTWNPAKGRARTVPILRVTLNQSGEVTNTQVIQQSNDPDANNSAMETIQQSAPFAPLPSGYQEVTLSLTFGQRVQGSVQGNV